uniref:Uncharacterized protein n=1 Tax=Lutzomyia longipalpis TaxID=7200 RepID=A0A1B0CHF6_LUTLO
MPILRRPTHMIIVTGMAPARGGVVGEQDDSSDAGGAMESNLAGPAGSQKAPTKLCALSLTARAAHGELPLPMPILRRPTHMIIVTGMAPARGGVVGEQDDSSDAGGAMESNLAGPAGSQKAPTKGNTSRANASSAAKQKSQRQKARPRASIATDIHITIPTTSGQSSRGCCTNLRGLLDTTCGLHCGYTAR